MPHSFWDRSNWRRMWTKKIECCFHLKWKPCYESLEMCLASPNKARRSMISLVIHPDVGWLLEANTYAHFEWMQDLQFFELTKAAIFQTFTDFAIYQDPLRDVVQIADRDVCVLWACVTTCPYHNVLRVKSQTYHQAIKSHYLFLPKTFS